MVLVNSSEYANDAAHAPPGAASAYPIGPAPGPCPPEQLVRRWLQCLNAHDLNGMLACMSADASFQPLRLHGVERTYQGHDGAARWHERLERLELRYHIDLDALTMPAERTVLATGTISFRNLDHLAPFWGVHTLDEGLIIAARHYLSDTDLAEMFALR
jgi:hypothetical protein